MIKKRGTFLVVLSLFLLAALSFLSLADVAGCYLYPEASEDLYCQAGILDTEAQVDCEFYDSCSMDQHFFPTSDCSELDECEEVICNVDCQTHALGICTQLGGTAVPDEEYDASCSPGCCKIEDKDFCQYNLFQFECEDKAKKLGSSAPPIFDSTVDINYCNTNICQVELKKASLTIIVQDEQEQPISGAEVILTATIPKQTTGTSGKTTFPGINSGTYSLTITATDYASGSLIVSLSSGEEAEQTVILKKVENIAVIAGTVSKTDPLGLLPGATVSWTGPVSGQTFTDDKGNYKTDLLPKGNYIFTASKVGVKAEEQPYSIQTAVNPSLDFLLTPTAALGISGNVYIDSDNDKLLTIGSDQVVYGATIYLDGVFKGYSTHPEGAFNIEVEVIGKETHNVSAVYQNFQYEQEFTFEKGKSLTENLLLTTYIGVCTEDGDGKPVKDFFVTPVPGEKVLKIEWTKPCPEVIGYQIIRSYQGEISKIISASPGENFILDDDELEWGVDYTYKIITHYDTESVESETEEPGNVGDKRCEGRYHSETGGWDTFCLVGDKTTRKTIWWCTDENILDPSKDCVDEPLLGEDYYCTQSSKTSATCQNAGNCGPSPQQADPFGIYYNRQQCYGGSPEEGTTNYCYFDYANTIFNECKSCSDQDMQSCFDYDSKDACEINNCLGTKCNWVNDAENKNLIDYGLINLPTSTTPETGTGYCVEEGYEEAVFDPEGDDYCSSCNPFANLFENNFCTAEVCSGLGRCFSAFNLAQCSSCGESPTPQSNCYAYNTELECTGQQNVQRDPYGKIINSNDECNWDKCLWTGTTNGYSENGCVKDGDGDGTSDCELFLPSEQNNCKLDHSAPKTKILPEGINVISYATPDIFLLADDNSLIPYQENFLGTASYCLTSTTFDNCFDKDLQSAFTEISYPGKALSESITLNLIDSAFLQGKKINGETYHLKYYSEDKFFNQESVQETFVYIDNVVPEFEINENINTVADTTALSVYLTGTKEIVGCTFTLNQILPLGGKKVIAVPREEEIKNALFENLKGVKFNLNVTCLDDAGNENSKVKDYIFDLEERIDIINPEMDSSVSETEISFKVNTVAGATCGLYLTANNEKIADFISDQEGKVHQTASLPGFFEKEYAGEHKVICNELLNLAETYEDYFNFMIDFSPPETQIILKEGIREEKPILFGWEEPFIEMVTIDFECSSTGFDCDKTYYCLGDNCQANFFTAEKSSYQEYTTSIELLESSTVCYYSTDLANNPVYQPVCGNVLIEGYGITLEKPEQHFYQEEQWGISNQQVFDFQFFTKVPTTECRIDFSSEFDYDALPEHKIKQINADKKYLFEIFPESVFTSYPDSCSGDDTSCVKTVYVKCKDLDGKVGPEIVIFLEYDPVAPEIINAFAEPDEVFEGVTTELFVDTDDKTLCKFSDGSDGTGSQEYGNMEYSFPGTIEKTLNLNHQEIFNINFVGPKKDYNLYTQCSNGASDLSLTEEITFSVDYSQIGYILENTLLPFGYVFDQNITISVGTSKNAFCKYDFNAEGYKPFTNPENQQIHLADISISEEGQHLIPVKCVMSDHTVFGEIKFTYDLTPPITTNIEDGNYTCGNEEMSLIVNTNENNITGYVYQVINQGKDVEIVKKAEQKKSKLAALANFAAKLQKNKSTEKEINETLSALEPKPVDTGKVGAIVLDGETGPELPLKISTKELILGNKYTVKVKAIDAAGNEGEFYESDGFAAVNNTYSSCLEKVPPKVSFSFNNNTCASVIAEMTCKYISGCKDFVYGKSGTEKLCNATENYLGQKITFDQSGWICYSVSDDQNITKNGTKHIPFNDKDGDKTLDSCDQCLETPSGKIVNKFGCAEGEVPTKEIKEDADGDGLPDKWEKSYNTFDCLLDYTNSDSDANGVADNEEDYDLDNINNYQEYLHGYNPCLADAPLEDFTEDPTLPTTPTYPLPSSTAGDNTLAMIFLLLGIMMIFGGVGYLVYYYIYSPAGKTATHPTLGRAPVTRKTGVASTIKPVSSNLKNKLLQLKKSRVNKLKQKKRRGLFGKFSPQSEKIPHLDRLIQKKNPGLSHLQNMAQKYSQHKEEIKPGLKSGEKSIFNKLDNIAKQTKDKKIHQVVNKSEAKDIFSKLKKISKKRKGK